MPSRMPNHLECLPQRHQDYIIIRRRSQVQGFPIKSVFRVTFLPVRRTQTGLSLTLLVGLFRPARRMAGGFSLNREPLKP